MIKYYIKSIPHQNGNLFLYIKSWVYKILHGLVRIDADKLFTPTMVKYTWSHALKVQTKRAMKIQRIRTFSVRVINNWNRLPSQIVEAPTLNIFKNRLDDHWHHLIYKCDISIQRYS